MRTPLGPSRRSTRGAHHEGRPTTVDAGGPLPSRFLAGLTACALVVVVTVPLGGQTSAGARTAQTAPTAPNAASGPRAQYRCDFHLDTDAFTGASGTASAIGWLSDHNSVITCLGGTFVVQTGPSGIFVNYGFGIYDGAPTTWADADGYLPAQITTFAHGGATVSITEFADRVVLGGHPYVAVYARVHVTNPTDSVVEADPEASPGLVALDSPPAAVPPHRSVNHDYVVVSDRFASSSQWPSNRALAGAGGFDQHFAHMRSFWNAQLDRIAQIDVPDPALVDAYKSGFITTQIARRGNALDTGINGYESEYSHDVIGILTNLFTQGYFTDAHALLTEARNVVGAQGQYVDGLWTYAVPWAVYLMKTGDTAFVRTNFITEGPAGMTQPSIADAAHSIDTDRTGPDGTMEVTNDIDTMGYWTVDDYEALLGLAAYRYIAGRLGISVEKTWATNEYDSLLSGTNTVLRQTISTYHLDYLPCSLVQPNTANRCQNPQDANWTSPFGFGTWAWESSLLGTAPSGPGLTMIDATYAYGFGRLRGILPPDTTGGFPDDYFYSSAYNAAQGSAGLAGTAYRDQGILGYEFMITNTQSGPFSWWESSMAPAAGSPWMGQHPTGGQGSSPHAWGMAGANKVLLDSLVAQRADGALIVGRGLPSPWLDGTPISVTNFPTTGGRRVGLTITSTGRRITLTLQGRAPGPILFQVPSFIDNIASTSTGHFDQAGGSVTVPPGTHRVTVEMQKPPSA